MARLPESVKRTLTTAAKGLSAEKKKKKKKEEALLKKVGERLKMIYYGSKYHAAKTKPKKKPKETAASLLTGYARGSRH